ncbi:hypothetical protein DP939_44365 [Spongiactinospora rosea]|uniref:Mutator family transposase n=1 Tax=Spongiactinospora rosea TaxID=2248750 RepID=A0A366LGA9_9ACTN|nr:hypothetical protein DP939_44365 [Spongiactinospora rosea]
MKVVGEGRGAVRSVSALRCEVRRVICSANAIESVNAWIRWVVKARGRVPNEQAALARAYMAIMSLEPTGRAAHAGAPVCVLGPLPGPCKIDLKNAMAACEGASVQELDW